MTRKEAKHKLDYMKKAYQKLIDEKVDSGKLVGDGVRGEWKAETPLDEVYKNMIETLEMAIKALEQQPTDAVDRQAVIDAIDALYLDGDSCVSFRADANGDALIGKYQAITALDDLPSVTAQPCEDCISREEVMHILDEVGGDFDSPREAVVPIDYIADMVSELPSVTPQLKMGRWIEDTNGTYTDNHDTWECSECGHAQILLIGTPIDNDYNYCPNCGCKMQGVEE